jgi:hypothetical protein
MLESYRRLIGMAIVLAAIAGCGDKKSSENTPSVSGPSLHEQYLRAVADKNPPSRADSLARIGYQQYKAGDASGADTSFREAAKAASEIDDPYRRATAEALLASACARSNNKAEASKLLKSATATTEKIAAVENQIDALSRVAAVFGGDLQESGNATAKLKEAEKLTDKVADPNDRLTALAAIIRAYHKSGKTADVDRLLGQASEFAAGISEPKQKADGLVTVSRAQVDCGHKEEGIAQLAAAADVAKQIDTPYSKAYALTTIAENYLHAGDSAAARGLIAEAEGLAKTIPETDLRQQTQERLRGISMSLTNSQAN